MRSRGGVKKEERFFSTWLAIKDMALSGNKLLLLESCRQTRVNMQGGQASEGVSGNQASISTDKCLAVNLLPESMHLCMSTHVEKNIPSFLPPPRDLTTVCMLVAPLLCIALHTSLQNTPLCTSLKKKRTSSSKKTYLPKKNAPQIAPPIF